MPVSTSTRPRRRLDEQAVERLEQPVLSSISSVTRSPHRTHGTGPNRVPASERNVPAWTSATVVAAAEVGAPVDRVVHAPSALRTATARRSCGRHRSRGGTPTRSAPTGPGTSSRARASRTAARPARTSGRTRSGRCASRSRARSAGWPRSTARGSGCPSSPGRRSPRRVDEQAESAQASSSPRAARRGRPAARPIRASGRGRTRPGGG